MKKHKGNIEKNLNITKCPICEKYNNNDFLKKYGKCNLCNTVLDEKAYFKYTMIRKLHLFKKKQIGYTYKKDAYEEDK